MDRPKVVWSPLPVYFCYPPEAVPAFVEAVEKTPPISPIGFSLIGGDLTGDAKTKAFGLIPVSYIALDLCVSYPSSSLSVTQYESISSPFLSNGVIAIRLLRP